jgi:hypothetical protein
MSLVGVSLNGAAAVGAGSSISFDRPRSNFSAQVKFTGTPNPDLSTTVVLESSLDGVSYFSCGVLAFTSQPSGVIRPSSSSLYLAPALFLRCRIEYLDSGTTAVTAIVAAN